MIVIYLQKLLNCSILTSSITSKYCSKPILFNKKSSFVGLLFHLPHNPFVLLKLDAAGLILILGIFLKPS